MRRSHKLIILCILAAIAGTALSYFLYNQWYVIDETSLPLGFEVVENPSIGVNIDTGGLWFGRVPLRGGAERELTLQSAVPAAAQLIVAGIPPGWLSATPGSPILAPGEPVAVRIAIDVPRDAPVGQYNGTLTIRYTRKNMG